MAETTGPARAWMKVSCGGYSQGKSIDFYAGGDTPDDVTEAFNRMFGGEATAEAIGKLLDVMTEDTTANAINNLQAQGMVDAGPRCKHGARVKREGRSGRGPWTGWFCPTPQGTPDQCKPEFE